MHPNKFAQIGKTDVVPVMSALLPKADVCGATSDVRYGPIADIARLFDHFVGSQQERLRDR